MPLTLATTGSAALAGSPAGAAAGAWAGAGAAGGAAVWAAAGPARPIAAGGSTTERAATRSTRSNILNVPSKLIRPNGAGRARQPCAEGIGGGCGDSRRTPRGQDRDAAELREIAISRTPPDP